MFIMNDKDVFEENSIYIKNGDWKDYMSKKSL